MTYSSNMEAMGRLFLFIGTASIPFSTSMMSIGLLLSVMFVLLSGQWSQKAHFFMLRPALWIPVILFLLIALSALHGEVPWHDRLLMLKKYHPLLTIPFLSWLLTEESARKTTLYVFLSAMLIGILLSFCLPYLYSTSLLHQTHDTTLFHDHISIGILSAFTVFALVQLARTSAGFARYGLWIAISFTTWYVLFMNAGRTGYLVFVALFVFLGWQTFRWKGLAISCATALILVAALLSLPSVFRTSTLYASHEAQLYLAGKKAADDTASLRIVAMKAALTLIKAHPLIGVGTGSFYQASLHLPGMTPNNASQHAYNDCLNLGAQTGLLGGLLVLFMYFVQWRQRNTLPDFYARLTEVVILTMLVSGQLNPVLLDTVEAHFYSVLIALCFAASKQSSADVTS